MLVCVVSRNAALRPSPDCFGISGRMVFLVFAAQGEAGLRPAATGVCGERLSALNWPGCGWGSGVRFLVLPTSVC